MWVARDRKGRNGNLPEIHMFYDKPVRIRDHWDIPFDYGNYKGRYEKCELNRDLFPDLTWEDEPREVFLFDSSLFENVSKLITEYNDNCHPSKEYIKERLYDRTVTTQGKSQEE